LGQGDESAWSFVRGKVEEAFDHLVDECDFPAYVDMGMLTFSLRRGRGSWNVRERVEVDRDGEVESREYVACEFEVSLRWRGRLTGGYLKFEWSEEGDFESVAEYDVSMVKGLFRRAIDVAEESGMLVEEDL
jgi:hypothetical protein